MGVIWENRIRENQIRDKREVVAVGKKHLPLESLSLLTLESKPQVFSIHGSRHRARHLSRHLLSDIEELLAHLSQLRRHLKQKWVIVDQQTRLRDRLHGRLCLRAAGRLSTNLRCRRRWAIRLSPWSLAAGRLRARTVWQICHLNPSRTLGIEEGTDRSLHIVAGILE